MSAPENRESLKSVNDHIAYYTGTHDTITGAQTVIDVVHQEIHKGTHFTTSGTITIDAGTANAYSFGVHPPPERHLHTIYIVSALNSGLMQVYENATYSGGGTVIPFNNNRNSSIAIGGTFVTDPTIASLGTLLQSRYIGSNNPGTRIGGETASRMEWVLNPSYKYIFWFVAENASTKVSADLETYTELTAISS